MASNVLVRQEFMVGNKKILLRIDWQKYSPKMYVKDFLDLASYNQKTHEMETPDLKRHPLKDLYQMPYESFIQLVEKIMAQIVKQALIDYPQAIIDQKGVFEIQIQMVRNENFEWYSNHVDEQSTLNHMYIQFNGAWMINNIAIPFNKKKIDYKLLYKFFIGTLTNYIDTVTKRYRSEGYSEKKHEGVIERTDNHSLFYLYLVFENLRVQGFAEWRQKKQMPSVQVHADWIRSFRPNIEKLIKLTGQEEAREFYESKFDAGAYDSTYYVGKIMCYTIGLATLKHMPGETIRINSRDIQYFRNKDRTKGLSFLLPDKRIIPITHLEEAMNTSTIFYGSQLPDDVFELTYKMINQVRYRRFIWLYEKACDDLGISEKNRIITYAFFDRMKKEATNFYRKRRDEKLKQKKYAPPEHEEDPDIDDEPAPKNVSASGQQEAAIPVDEIARHDAEQTYHARKPIHEIHTNANRPERPSRAEAPAQAHESHSEIRANQPEHHGEKTHTSTSDPASGMMITGAIVAAIIAAIILLGYLGR